MAKLARNAAATRPRCLRHAGSFRFMPTIQLTDDEFRLLISAVHSYLDDFGHEEADVLRKVKELLQKLQAAAPA
jgi:hypothetical protein